MQFYFFYKKGTMTKENCIPLKTIYFYNQYSNNNCRRAFSFEYIKKNFFPLIITILSTYPILFLMSRNNTVQDIQFRTNQRTLYIISTMHSSLKSINLQITFEYYMPLISSEIAYRDLETSTQSKQPIAAPSITSHRPVTIMIHSESGHQSYPNPRVFPLIPFYI